MVVPRRAVESASTAFLLVFFGGIVLLILLVPSSWGPCKFLIPCCWHRCRERRAFGHSCASHLHPPRSDDGERLGSKFRASVGE